MYTNPPTAVMSPLNHRPQEMFYTTYAVPLSYLRSSLTMVLAQLATFLKWLATPDEEQLPPPSPPPATEKRKAPGSSGGNGNSPTAPSSSSSSDSSSSRARYRWQQYP